MERQLGTARGQGALWGLVGLLLLSACGSPASAATSVTKLTNVAVSTDLDRESSAQASEDPYEVMPKARYKLAPGAPTSVAAKAGAPGSGLIAVSWQETWLGRGYFSGFTVTEMPGGKALSVMPDARTVTWTGLAAGTYSFVVSAHGQYADIESGASGAVTLLPTPPAPVVSVAGCGYLIDVNLTTQSLVASRCGNVYLRTLITSGMPGLRTPTGRYSIFLKEHNVYFYSPWPKTSSYWYPPMFVAYAAEFAGGGYFLHTDPNEPGSAFGPGSQNGPYASHGCVHVPYGVMANLYAWAPDGTRVYIHY